MRYLNQLIDDSFLPLNLLLRRSDGDQPRLNVVAHVPPRPSDRLRSRSPFWQRRVRLNTVALVRLHYATASDARCSMSLITIAILVLHLLIPAHPASLKDAQDDINVFR